MNLIKKFLKEALIFYISKCALIFVWMNGLCVNFFINMNTRKHNCSQGQRQNDEQLNNSNSKTPCQLRAACQLFIFTVVQIVTLPF